MQRKLRDGSARCFPGYLSANLACGRGLWVWRLQWAFTCGFAAGRASRPGRTGRCCSRGGGYSFSDAYKASGSCCYALRFRQEQYAKLSGCRGCLAVLPQRLLPDGQRDAARRRSYALCLVSLLMLTSAFCMRGCGSHRSLRYRGRQADARCLQRSTRRPSGKSCCRISCAALLRPPCTTLY